MWPCIPLQCHPYHFLFLHSFYTGLFLLKTYQDLSHLWTCTQFPHLENFTPSHPLSTPYTSLPSYPSYLRFKVCSLWVLPPILPFIETITQFCDKLLLLFVLLLVLVLVLLLLILLLLHCFLCLLLHLLFVSPIRLLSPCKPGACLLHKPLCVLCLADRAWHIPGNHQMCIEGKSEWIQSISNDE